jgi:hypothetical protein
MACNPATCWSTMEYLHCLYVTPYSDNLVLYGGVTSEYSNYRVFGINCTNPIILKIFMNAPGTFLKRYEAFTCTGHLNHKFIQTRMYLNRKKVNVCKSCKMYINF